MKKTLALAALFPQWTFALLALPWPGGAFAQIPANWTDAIEPFSIADHLHYVGSADLTAFLFTSDDGHILIDAPLEQNVELILAWRCFHHLLRKCFPLRSQEGSAVEYKRRQRLRSAAKRKSAPVANVAAASIQAANRDPAPRQN